MTPFRAALGLLALHATLILVADEVGLVEAMLSPGGARALLALPLGLALLVARVLTPIVVPALLLEAAWGAARARRPAVSESGD